MNTGRTFRIVNGPTKEELLKAQDGSYGERKGLVFFLKEDDSDKTSFQSDRVLIISATPVGPLGVSLDFEGDCLEFEGNCGQGKGYRHVVGTYHSTTKTGRITFTER